MYVAPKGTKIFRAQHSNRPNNKYYTLNKNLALGYMNFDSKLVYKDIGGQMLCYIEEIKDYPKGIYFDEIVKIYPELIDSEGLSYKDNISKTEIYNTIEPFIKSKGFSGLIDNNNNEIYYF
jgi:hypothetical protein